MIEKVRINEVIASIAISSGGTGESTIETVVKDLHDSIGASDIAVRSALNRAVELGFVSKDENTIYIKNT